MIRRISRRTAKALALKPNDIQFAQGGLAFLIAYTLAYVFFA